MSEYAESVANEFKLSQPSRLLIFLDGPMGAGKTFFTTQFVKKLQTLKLVDSPQSPTFSLHNSYVIDSGVVEHFDLFRLQSEEDLESTGFWDFFSLKNGVIIVEWSEKIFEFGLQNQVPKSWPQISLKISIPENGSEKRLILRE